MEKQDIIEKINLEKAYVLAYFYNKVCIGIFENKDIIFNENVDYKLLTQIRVFNHEKEIRIVLNEDTKRFETIIIEDLDNENKLDEYMMVAGNKIEEQNNRFTTVTQLGRKIDLPFKVTEEEAKKGIRLVVRNYFEEDSNNQVIISKSRFVGFTKKEGGEWIGI